MKNTNIIIAFLLGLLALTACHKDKEMDVKEAVVSNVEMTVSGTQVCFSWQVDFAGQFQTGVEVSQNENMADLRRVEASKQEDKFVAVVDSLTEGTNYYYRFVVWNKFGSSEQSVGNFKTMETPPTPGQDTTYYNITVSVNLPEGGTATGGGRFAEGDTCRVIATANEGYVFVNWTENDNPIDTNSVYSFVVSSDRELVANFSEEGVVLYTVITKAEPVEGGIVTGGGTYEEGREIELKATANTGYTFIHWDDGSTDNPRRVTVTADVTYTAYFNHDEYEIKVECQPENGGTATGGGMFHYGDTIALSATPNANFSFAGWSDGSADNPHEVVVTGPVTYKAIFSEAGAVYYHVTTHAQPIEGGEVMGEGTYLEGIQVEMSATPNVDAGYIFEKWDDGNTDNPRTITVNSDMEFTAFFKKKTYTITVQAGTGGTAHIGDMTGTIEATFEHGESCTVHALPETGYSFVNWTENGIEASTDENYSFNVTSNHNLVANFQQQQYWIGTLVEPTNSGIVSGGNLYYNHGEQCNLTAMANNNAQYEFDYWTKDGSTYSGGSTITFTVTEAATYTAHFRLRQYTVSVSASPSNGGTVNGGGIYSYGQSCLVTAEPKFSYAFLYWTENGDVVSEEASYPLIVNNDRDLVANFQQLTSDQIVNVNGVSFTMKRVEGGTFWMGAQSINPSGQNFDSEAYDNESPVHSVTLSSYYIGETEVTQELWQAVMGSNPSYFSGTNLPVERVSWNMIINDFLPALNMQTGFNFRLPTEAEWEYAARGGNHGHGYKYAGGDTIDAVAWYSVNSDSQPHPVGAKSPNELGVYDMSGNVQEWCNDNYGSYSSGTQIDPQGPSSGGYRVRRGGSWLNVARHCRVSDRGSSVPSDAGYNNGFRLVHSQ